MIAPSPEKKSVPQPPFPARLEGVHLPEYRRLLSAACFVAAPLVALYLLFGKFWSAASVVAGAVISLTVCGLLHFFVERVMPYFVAAIRGQTGKDAKNGPVLQFLGLVAVKFLVLCLVGYAILNFKMVNLAAVLMGFVLAQTAIVFTVAKRLKTR